MKTRILTVIALSLALTLTARAQVLFTTTNDFTAWNSNSGFTIAPVTAPDSDSSTVNGLGNTNAPGGVDTGGSLQIQWGAGSGIYGYPAFSEGEQSNSAFLAALQRVGTTLTFDYSTPTNDGGSYFQLGIVINCQGRFDQIFPSTSTVLGSGWTRASIDWSSEASALVAQQAANGGGFTYFQIGLIWNSDDTNQPGPFYLDNIVLHVQPPAPTELYTTTDDFGGWTTETGFSNVGSTNFDLDGSVTNGLGNGFNPGAVGYPGSLGIQWTNGTYGVASYLHVQGNGPVVAELLNATTLTFDYTIPPANGGTYFDLGIVVSCQGRYDQIFPTTTTPVSNGIMRASIDWSSEAAGLVAQKATNGGGFNYFQIGIIWNSDYGPTNTPFQVDNIAVVLPPAPAHVAAVGATLVSESCLPTNGVIDPDETVTVNLTLQNTGGVDASNVVATLPATGGVTLPSGAQSYGTLLSGGPAVSRPFTFTATGMCGSALTATLQIQTNSVSAGTVPFSFVLGVLTPTATNTYSSGGVSVPIPDAMTFLDWGSITNPIVVSDTDLVAHVIVSVRIEHPYDGNLRIDLVHPDGTTVHLANSDPSNYGNDFGSGATDCTGTFTVFDDLATTSFVSVAESGSPYEGTFSPSQPLSTLSGKPMQGTWNLVVIDEMPGNTGTLDCWQLQIAGQTYVCCSAPADLFTTWQGHYFTPAELGDPAVSGPNADPLGKGISNTNQFLAGFNPTNNTAYLHIISISKTNSTDINVVYLGANGDSSYTGGPSSRTNVLEYTTGTANGSYSNNFASAGQTNILSGGTGLGIITNMVDSGGATNTPSRYYRVRVLVP